MAYTVPAPLLGVVKAQTKYLATCWRFARRDGVVIRLTTHNRELHIGAERYSPVGSFTPSAIRKNAGLEEADVEFTGVISSAALTTADFNAGKYRDCEVLEQRLDARWDWLGLISSSKYWIQDTSFDGEAWQCSCVGIPRWLRPKVGDVYGRNCRHKLGFIPPGGSGCGVNIASFTVAGAVVDGTLDGDRRRIIRIASGPLDGFADGFFASGDVLFTSGLNTGALGLEVKTWTQATRDLELQLPAPYDVLPGDVLTVKAGCNKLGTTCINKFNQFVDFGGFPDIPGIDKVLRVTPQG